MTHDGQRPFGAVDPLVEAVLRCHASECAAPAAGCEGSQSPLVPPIGGHGFQPVDGLVGGYRSTAAGGILSSTPEHTGPELEKPSRTKEST